MASKRRYWRLRGFDRHATKWLRIKGHWNTEQAAQVYAQTFFPRMKGPTSDEQWREHWGGRYQIWVIPPTGQGGMYYVLPVRGSTDF